MACASWELLIVGERVGGSGSVAGVDVGDGGGAVVGRRVGDSVGAAVGTAEGARLGAELACVGTRVHAGSGLCDSACNTTRRAKSATPLALLKP